MFRSPKPNNQSTTKSIATGEYNSQARGRVGEVEGRWVVNGKLDRGTYPFQNLQGRQHIQQHISVEKILYSDSQAILAAGQSFRM